MNLGVKLNLYPQIHLNITITIPSEWLLDLLLSRIIIHGLDLLRQILSFFLKAFLLQEY